MVAGSMSRRESGEGIGGRIEAKRNGGQVQVGSWGRMGGFGVWGREGHAWDRRGTLAEFWGRQDGGGTGGGLGG